MLQGMVLKHTFLKNWKLYLLLVVLMSVIAVAGYLLGYSASEKDTAAKTNEALQLYIKDNEVLKNTILELNSKQPQVVEKIVVQYIERVNEVDENTKKAIADVESGNIGLYGEAIRDAEASAATANLTAATVGAHAARSCRLSNEVSKALLEETGRADRVAIKLELLQKYVLSVHDYIDQYNETTKRFYKENGYAVDTEPMLDTSQMSAMSDRVHHF